MHDLFRVCTVPYVILCLGPVPLLIFVRPRLQRRLDVVEGGVNVIVRGKLHHALDQFAHAQVDRDHIFFFPCIGVNAGVIHDYGNCRGVLLKSARGLCLN